MTDQPNLSPEQWLPWFEDELSAAVDLWTDGYTDVETVTTVKSIINELKEGRTEDAIAYLEDVGEIYEGEDDA